MKRTIALIRITLACLAWASLQACSTAGALQVARDQFTHGSTSEALQTLAEADVSRRDRLLLYFDRGIIAQAAGQYEDSIQAFDRAASLIQQLDYVSVRDQSAAMVSSDWATRYAGEYSERLWVHTFQMINFLMLDLPGGAAVEARRAVKLMDSYGKVLDQDLFTRSLMALSFMASGRHDSASVEYRKLKDDFGLNAPAPLARDEGELVLFIASGFIDRKLPGDLAVSIDAHIAFPYYAPSFDVEPRIEILGDEGPLTFSRIDTSLSRVSGSALAERGKAIAARQALRIAAKYNLANAIDEQDPVAGGIARVLLFAIEQADTRSWETLPAYLSLVRLRLSEGSHSLSLAIDDLGNGTRQVMQRRHLELDIKAGERQYRAIRVGIQPD